MAIAGLALAMGAPGERAVTLKVAQFPVLAARWRSQTALWGPIASKAAAAGTVAEPPEAAFPARILRCNWLIARSAGTSFRPAQVGPLEMLLAATAVAA